MIKMRFMGDFDERLKETRELLGKNSFNGIYTCLQLYKKLTDKQHSMETELANVCRADGTEWSENDKLVYKTHPEQFLKLQLGYYIPKERDFDMWLAVRQTPDDICQAFREFIKISDGTAANFYDPTFEYCIDIIKGVANRYKDFIPDIIGFVEYMEEDGLVDWKGEVDESVLDRYALLLHSKIPLLYNKLFIRISKDTAIKKTSNIVDVTIKELYASDFWKSLNDFLNNEVSPNLIDDVQSVLDYRCLDLIIHNISYYASKAIEYLQNPDGSYFVNIAPIKNYIEEHKKFVYRTGVSVVICGYDAGRLSEPPLDKAGMEMFPPDMLIYSAEWAFEHSFNHWKFDEELSNALDKKAMLTKRINEATDSAELWGLQMDMDKNQKHIAEIEQKKAKKIRNEMRQYSDDQVVMNISLRWVIEFIDKFKSLVAAGVEKRAFDLATEIEGYNH